MRKTRKVVAVMLLMVFGVVSVSFGVDLCNNKENYQKLKAEVAEYGNAEECKWSEDGKKIISESVDWRLCETQKVVLFFDEIRATEVEKEFCVADLKKAVKKVREIPLFKNDSSIYAWVKGNNFYSNNEGFWRSVWNKWDLTKIDLEMDGARRGYWKEWADSVDNAK